jgi:predicted RNase H-like HicB family nuclease
MIVSKSVKLDPYAPVPPEVAAQVAEIMKRPYRKVITGDAEDGYIVDVAELPGCSAGGDTPEEALAELPDAMIAYLESMLLAGETVPEPDATHQYNGKVLVRMPKTLHRRLIERAEDEGVSANQLAVALLSHALATFDRPPGAPRHD